MRDRPQTWKNKSLHLSLHNSLSCSVTSPSRTLLSIQPYWEDGCCCEWRWKSNKDFVFVENEYKCLHVPAGWWKVGDFWQPQPKLWGEAALAGLKLAVQHSPAILLDQRLPVLDFYNYLVTRADTLTYDWGLLVRIWSWIYDVGLLYGLIHVDRCRSFWKWGKSPARQTCWMNVKSWLPSSFQFLCIGQGRMKTHQMLQCRQLVRLCLRNAQPVCRHRKFGPVLSALNLRFIEFLKAHTFCCKIFIARSSLRLRRVRDSMVWSLTESNPVGHCQFCGSDLELSCFNIAST